MNDDEREMALAMIVVQVVFERLIRTLTLNQDEAHEIVDRIVDRMSDAGFTAQIPRMRRELDARASLLLEAEEWGKHWARRRDQDGAQDD
jgi:hypothetical protein